MTQPSENLDFSGLFKLDVLVQLDIKAHSFYEVGLQKYLAFSSDKELIFVYINSQGDRLEKKYDWDFFDNPVYCMCFEPSGTWLLIVSEEKVLLVPFLPLFNLQHTFDQKWSLNSVTVLPLGSVAKPVSVVWWLTKDSDNVIIIGSESGTISFYSLESQCIIGETKVASDILELQICFDDSLDLLTLVISGSKTQQWKLILEHRSTGYNWLQQIRLHADRDKKDGFISYIKQLSKDKINFLTQGGSRDDKTSMEDMLIPTEYLPSFRKGSNNWALTSQYVNGRHFLTAFEVNDGTLILESPEEDTPSRTLRPKIKKDVEYIQGLWSPRLIYLLRRNQLEIHSASFSVVQGETVPSTKREFSELWVADLIGDVQKAYLMSAKEPPVAQGGWREPTFLCDLQLPRFCLEPCLVVTNSGAYIVNTVCEPCEWVVGLISRGGAGAELSALALGAPVASLLRASADLLLSRGKVAPAHYLYSLSQCPSDGWVARLGVFGRVHELAMFKQSDGTLGNAAIAVKLLALLLRVGTNCEEKFDTNTKFTTLTPVELEELSSITAAIGLWELLPMFSIHRGHPTLMLAALKARSNVCRGALNSLLSERCLVPLLLEENAQWLFHFITGQCETFDLKILKNLCLWLNPLQDQLRPVMRDLKQGITSLYTTRMLNLITTFIHVASAIELREPCLEIKTSEQTSETWKNQYVPKRAVSCGLAHWAVIDDGKAKIMMADTTVNTEVIGRVMDIACGRHHTLVLTENGIYAAGDNSYGQLGVGTSWAGAIGDAATAAGALMHLALDWTAPLVQVAAGHYHSAAVDAGGRLYTWGWGVHGQLGLGSIDDQCTPQLVTKFQGRKVLSVGCGACHTVVLMKNGEVWACGAGVFGQLGQGGREKATLPVRVVLNEPIEAIAVGYFHTLALSSKDQLYSWGASPQQVRAAHARRTSSPSYDCADSHEPHLLPAVVDTQNVRGRIVQISAGWHHSVIVNNVGTMYSWGLNFDGQLGTGDRKQAQIPTEVKFRPEQGHDRGPAKTPEELKDMRTDTLVACGGDFTVYVDEDGRIYVTGNIHKQVEREKDSKLNNRVIMMKTTKRVIRIPANRANSFLFQSVDRIDIMFPFDIEDSNRKPIESNLNPLMSIQDFDKKTWADDVITQLKPWINEDNLSANRNMSAKLAYHNKSYEDCLRLLLENLKTAPQEDPIYLKHTEVPDDGIWSKEKGPRNELKFVITDVMSKRIKAISLSILNEDPYPTIDPSVFETLPCCCDEASYFIKEIYSESIVNITEQNLSLRAAHIIDTCISMFPVDTQLWETCFRLSKNFYLDNNLCITELETVLRKYMESNATTMTAAIMCSNDCAQYSKILSPKFYLNMCSQVLDTWG